MSKRARQHVAVDEEPAAYLRGWQDFFDGIHHNPYPFSSMAAAAWEAGRYDAMAWAGLD